MLDEDYLRYWPVVLPEWCDNYKYYWTGIDEEV